jgi:hypothetical protein
MSFGCHSDFEQKQHVDGCCFMLRTDWLDNASTVQTLAKFYRGCKLVFDVDAGPREIEIGTIARRVIST